MESERYVNAIRAADRQHIDFPAARRPRFEGDP
jgi:hypothetical protein